MTSRPRADSSQPLLVMLVLDVSLGWLPPAPQVFHASLGQFVAEMFGFDLARELVERNIARAMKNSARAVASASEISCPPRTIALASFSASSAMRFVGPLLASHSTTSFIAGPVSTRTLLDGTERKLPEVLYRSQSRRPPFTALDQLVRSTCELAIGSTHGQEQLHARAVHTARA